MNILEKPNNPKPIKSHIVVETIYNFVKNRDIICVSLSGGVDSMVITRVLRHLYETNRIRSKIICIHINYNNRDESLCEATFLSGWCCDNGIDIYVKNINDLKRRTCARKIYEEKTRTIRFDFYKEIQQKLGYNFPILLGHHSGDIEENVMSNIMKGNSLCDLSGMKSSEIINEVEFWRPLLTISKDYIYDFAHKFGVPYFKDTTPKWSIRGKTRNILFPAFFNTYGKIFRSKLHDMANNSDELSELLSKKVYDPFIKKYITRYNDLSIITYSNDLDSGKYFWKYIIRIECHRLNVSMISNKSFNLLFEKMKARKSQKLNLKRDLECHIDNKQIFLGKKI